MTAKTPVYQLEYIVEGESARNARGALERNAKSIEAALVAGGVTPPGASDLAALAGRVAALEAITAWADLPVIGAPYLAHYTLGTQAGAAAGPGPTKIQYRLYQGRVWFRGWGFSSTSGYAAGGGTGFAAVLATPLAAAFRPPVTATLNLPTSAGAIMRHEMSPAGQLNGAQTVPPNTYMCFDGLSYSVT